MQSIIQALTNGLPRSHDIHRDRLQLRGVGVQRRRRGNLVCDEMIDRTDSGTNDQTCLKLLGDRPCLPAGRPLYL